MPIFIYLLLFYNILKMTNKVSIAQTNKQIYSKGKLDISKAKHKQLIRLVAGEKKGKLLDIGCSSGFVSLPFVKAGWEVYGVDIAKEKLKAAKKKGLKVKEADISKGLPYKNASFDMIFACEVIEHLVDTGRFLSEVHRVLRKGGVFVITTPNLCSLENRVRILFGIYPIWVNYDLKGGGHIRAYTPKTLKKQMADYGFKIEKHIGNFVPIVPQYFLDDIKFPLYNLTGYLFPNLSMDIIIKARKA
jgi:2-polyprenyl-3-methyl-5-hydroxy-6-metoxy-1,4-benzoquinol methylase